MKPRDMSVSVVQSSSETLSVNLTFKITGVLAKEQINSDFSKVSEKSRKDMQKALRKILEQVELPVIGMENKDE
jgi:Ni,Fe-hydrogenase maturation factor